MHPLFILLPSIALGGGLGLVTNRHGAWITAMRTFSTAAVLSVALAQLLPDAASNLGLWALGVFAAALALPGVVTGLHERVRARMRTVDRSAEQWTAKRVGHRLGLAGLTVHQLVEGLALGTLGTHGATELSMAVGAHTVPLVAVFAAGTFAARGRRAALLEVGALLAATVVGFALAGTLNGAFLSALEPWLLASVAGFFCHVVFHHQQDAWQSRRLTGALDVAMVVAGAWVVIAAADIGEHAPAAVIRAAVGDAFVVLLQETAPMLLLGLGIAATLQLVGERSLPRWTATGGAWRQAAMGLAMGAPLPLCACGVLPVAESLRRKGAGPAFVLAFLVATPELGAETVVLTVRFMGWPFALVRLFAVVLLAMLAAVLFARTVASRDVPMPVPEESVAPVHGAIASRWLHAFDELLLHIAPWALVGLLAAAYLQALLPQDGLAALAGSGLDLLVVAAVALPSYVCPASATPLAAVLLAKGMSPGAALLGLLIGPATNVATIGLLHRGYGRAATATATLAMLVLSLGVALVVNVVGVPLSLQAEGGAHNDSIFAGVSVGLLALGLVVQLWRYGVKPWLAVLDPRGHAQHVHAHGHAHHHTHGHHHAH